MDSKSWLRRIVVTLLVGGLFRLLLLVGPLATMPQTEDGPSYRKQSLEILSETADYFYFPPGTAIAAAPFYALFGDSQHVDHLVATFFWMLFCVACSWLAWLVLEDKQAAWLATLLAVCLPHGILATATISSQPLNAALVTVVLCLAIVSYTRFTWTLWFLIGIVTGMAIITRPASAVLTAALVGYLLVLFNRKLISFIQLGGSIALLSVAVACFVYPVMSHNQTHGQGMTLSTNSEWNLLVGNNPYTPDYKTGHLGQRRFEQLADNARAYLNAILPHGEPARATYLERQAMRDTALDYIARNPVRFVYRAFNRFRAFWGMDYTAARELQNVFLLSTPATMLLLLIEGGGYLVVLVLAVIAFMLNLSSGWYRRVCLALVGVSIIPYLLAFTVAKYHTVAMPLLFPPAASLILGFYDRTISCETLNKRRNVLLIMLVVIALMQIEHVFHIVDNK